MPKKKKLEQWLVDSYSVPGVSEVQLPPKMRHPYTWPTKRQKWKRTLGYTGIGIAFLIALLVLILLLGFIALA